MRYKGIKGINILKFNSEVLKIVVYMHSRYFILGGCGWL